jgi:hypothetical protein
MFAHLRGFLIEFVSNCLFRASSAFKIFEAELRSLEFFFRLAAPSRYSGQDFSPSNYLFRARSAFKIFGAGLRSLELSFSGPQRLRDIRGRSSVPWIVPFGPVAPSRYSRPDFGSSNCFLVSSTFTLFEVGFRSLDLPFSAQLCFQRIRARSCGLSNHPF